MPGSILPVPFRFVASDSDCENPDSVRPDAARVKDAALIKTAAVVYHSTGHSFLYLKKKSKKNSL
jgi:hypothetical protein